MACFFFLQNHWKTYQHFYEKHRYNLERPSCPLKWLEGPHVTQRREITLWIKNPTPHSPHSDRHDILGGNLPSVTVILCHSLWYCCCCHWWGSIRWRHLQNTTARCTHKGTNSHVDICWASLMTVKTSLIVSHGHDFSQHFEMFLILLSLVGCHLECGLCFGCFRLS